MCRIKRNDGQTCNGADSTLITALHIGVHTQTNVELTDHPAER